MQNEVYGYSTDVNGAIYYENYPELFLANELASERQDLITSEVAHQAIANNKLIELRLNQKMTERLAQADFQRPPAQTQAYTTMNTNGIAGLDAHGRPQMDVDYDLRGAPSVNTRGQGRARRTIRI